MTNRNISNGIRPFEQQEKVVTKVITVIRTEAMCIRGLCICMRPLRQKLVERAALSLSFSIKYVPNKITTMHNELCILTRVDDFQLIACTAG